MFFGRGFSAMKDDEIVAGRPFGGLGIMWRKTLCWESVQVQSICSTVMLCKFKQGNVVLNVVNTLSLCWNSY
jgi:hypothetical protein